MKINKILSICAAMALLSSGCSDDLGLQPDNAPVAGTGQTVRITASMGDNGSRLAFNETDTEVTLSWEQGDILKVLNPTRDTLITDFALVDGEGTSLANFEGTPANAYVEGDPLYALYYNDLVETDIDADGNVSIALTNQNGTLNQDFQLMYGSTVYEGEGSSLSVKMENLVSIIKVTIPTDKTLTTIQLTEAFRTKGKLVLQNSPSDAPYQTFQPGDLVHNREMYDYNEEGQYIGNNGITLNGAFEPVDGEVTVYFYVLPVKEYRPEQDWYSEMGRKPSFVAYDAEGHEYFSVKEFDMKWMERGKMYEVRSDIFEVVDFENESVANGSLENPYEIATAEQLYSFMLRCKKGQTNKYGIGYQDLSYKLTSDIVLDNRIYWHSFNFYGTFDGDGHTVSGSIPNPFISWLHNGAVVCNLVLDLDFIKENIDHGDFACLATVVNNSKVINVVNHSDLDVNASSIGGLVGIMENNASMIGCINTGNITTSYDEVNCMGGLASKIFGGSKVEACYNTGNVTATAVVKYDNAYFGGIVGYMAEIWNGENEVVDFDGDLTSCWTSGNLNVEIDAQCNSKKDDLIATGKYISCYKVDAVPSAEQIAEMNAAMTNALYEFDAAGNIVAKKPSISLPDIEIEDF